MEQSLVGFWIRALAVCAVLASGTAAAAKNPVKAELDRLADKIDRPAIAIELPEAGSYNLGVAESVTAENLRGVDIDDNPPAFAFEPTYPSSMADGVTPGAEPYQATGIKPFRFSYFNNEWNYTGWHTWEMSDYGMLHGFNISALYNNRSTASVPVPNTLFLQASGFSWDGWMGAHSYGYRRWDQLPTRETLVTTLLAENNFPYINGYAYRMIDMESPAAPYSQGELQSQPWYPQPIPNGEFESQYYAGFVKTQASATETAKRQGWPMAGVYGWQPFPRIWFGLENVVLDPATDWRWNTYGKFIYRDAALNLLYPSVYSFYWDERNVAYTLATIDLNMKLVNSETERKPVRPYFWHQLHGGGGGWRWWAQQPQRNEDMAAMIAMAFFTGVDGITLWGWSGTNNPHVVNVVEDRDYTVGLAFALVPEDTATWGSKTTEFSRYDAVHVLHVDANGIARFQHIVKDGSSVNYGVDKGWQPGDPATFPIYALTVDQLNTYLRAESEAVVGVTEGLALAKPFEYLLRHGKVKIDVPAQQQFKNVSPIVRRVSLGHYHLLATYDPTWQRAGYAPRSVTLADFDGIPGLNLTLLADGETRFYVVKAP